MTAPSPAPLPADGAASSEPIADAWTCSRASDWRYLLPPSGPGGFGRILLAGGTDAIASDVRRAGVADEVLRDRCPPAAADAAVVLRGSDLAIANVAAMLAPGGVLYWEVSRARASRMRVTPASARAALRRHGMTPIESYWVTSGASGPSMHLPLSRDGAVGWYFAVHHGPPSAARRILGRVLRFLSQGRAGRLERIVPVFAITARRPPRDREGTLPGATALATADVPAWAVAGEARPIVLGGGEGPWSRVVLLPFGRGADRPAGVIKVARTSAYEGGLVAEQRALASLRATVPASIRRSLPEPLGCARVLGQPGSAETYRPGASIAARSTRFDLRRATRRADLERAADWLRELHVATAAGSVSLGPAGLDAGGLTDRYAQVFGQHEKEERLFRHLRGAILDVDHPVPQVTRHRDFGPWNVLVDTGGQLSVIDWEVAGPGPPLVDLVYFVAHWTWIVAASSSVREDAQLIVRLVDGGAAGWHTTAGRSVIAGHAREIGLTADQVALLFAWTFIEQALDRHDRLVAIGDPAAADRSSNRYVRYVSALAELPDLRASIAGWLESHRDRDP